MPGNGFGVVIAVGIPGNDFSLEGWQVSYATSKALFSEGSQFNFCHIKPRAMFWCVMEFKTIKEFSSDFWTEGFVKGSRFVGVEIVTDQENFFGIRIFDIEHVLNFLRPIDHGAVFFGPNATFPG